MCAFLVSYFPGFFTDYIFMGSQLVGIIRRKGYPKFNMEYAQGIVNTREFLSISFFLSTMLARRTFFVWSPLLISIVLKLALDFKALLEINPDTPGISHPTVKNYVLMAAGG
jgi:hypothetical protein